MEFFERLLSSSIYSPHGICLLWEPQLIWLHVISDALTAVAYFSIPFALGTFVYRRRDLKFGWVFIAFAMFIMACGITHVLGIYTLWIPVYGIEGLAKAATAIASVVTASVLWSIMPKLLALPSAFEMRQVYAALEEEEKRSEGLLQRFRDLEATDLQIRQAQKMEAIGQLTGGIAHDFNNILTVITGTIEIVADAVKDRSDLCLVTSLIENAALRGAALTHQLLAFARKQPLQPRPVEVNGLIRECYSLLKPTLGENITIDMSLGHDPIFAMIDPSQLSTAILNLALNARDAMAHGGGLSFKSDVVVVEKSYLLANTEIAAGNYATIEISDTGEGIAPEYLTRVFEPFFTTKEVGKGTGLGLSMVYGFIKQSNGHIEILSELGCGTTVKLYLPRLNDVSESCDSRTTSGDCTRGKETILVAEDDHAVRGYVSLLLESLGYKVLAAKNANDALAILDEAPKVDLLFTDVIMPGNMNGRELADAVKQKRPETRILFTSGYTDSVLIRDGQIEPNVTFLAKPYRRSDLSAAIRKALSPLLAPGTSPAD